MRNRILGRYESQPPKGLFFPSKQGLYLASDFLRVYTETNRPSTSQHFCLWALPESNYSVQETYVLAQQMCNFGFILNQHG